MQASAAMKLSEVAKARQMAQKSKKSREEMTLGGLDDAEYEGPAVNTNDPVRFDKDRMKIADKRNEIQLPTIAPKNEKEREIEHKLIMPLTLDFKNTPLKQVVEDLRTWTGINIVLDKRALDEESISQDQTVDMKLDGVSLKSALTNVLHQVHLTYVIEDEVLKITTEAHAKGRMVLKTYQVADLVIPIEDHNAPTAAAFAESLGVSVPGSPESRSMSSSGPIPQTGPHSLPNGWNCWDTTIFWNFGLLVTMLMLKSMPIRSKNASEIVMKRTSTATSWSCRRRRACKSSCTCSWISGV